MKKFLAILAILSMCLLSCTAHISLPITRPAAITVDKNIKSLALVNRSVPASRVLNTIEGVITGEGISMDKEGAEQALQQLSSTIARSERFNVKLTSEIIKEGRVDNTMADPMNWATIERLCRTYQVDGIIALELFDSDFIITKGKREKGGEKEGEKTKIVFFAEGMAQVNIGFRLYDARNRSITDQHKFTHKSNWKTEAPSLRAALNKLIDRRKAVLQVSRNSGASYAKRIIPSVVYASRPYYKKPKKNTNFSMAVRQAQSGDWEGALESWKKASQSTHRKTAGRAIYNAAIVFEVMGELQTAKEWAQKAWVEYKVKKARDYAVILEYRMRDEEKLRMQME